VSSYGPRELYCGGSSKTGNDGAGETVVVDGISTSNTGSRGDAAWREMRECGGALRRGRATGLRGCAVTAGESAAAGGDADGVAAGTTVGGDTIGFDRCTNPAAMIAWKPSAAVTATRSGWMRIGYSLDGRTPRLF
jgi:hypothetical protein